MTDIQSPAEPAGFELPMQPTGSGVADLEIAYEQMKLAGAADPAAADPGVDGGSPQARQDAASESEAHPS